MPGSKEWLHLLCLFIYSLREVFPSQKNIMKICSQTCVSFIIAFSSKTRCTKTTNEFFVTDVIVGFNAKISNTTQAKLYF